MKIALGFLLAFLIGVGCRAAALPLPAPPVLIGAALVVAMTLDYLALAGFTLFATLVAHDF